MKREISSHFYRAVGVQPSIPPDVKDWTMTNLKNQFVFAMLCLFAALIGVIHNPCSAADHEVNRPLGLLDISLAYGKSVIEAAMAGPASANPTSITAPFYGAIGGNGDSVKWYDLTGSTAHKDYGTFDDTNAYDFNLESNREQNLPAVAAAAGTVTTLAKAINRPASDFPGTLSGGTYGQVLIDHGDWCEGIMHVKDIKVKDGDVVSAGQLLGSISGTGGVPIHLHFAKYKKVEVGTKPGTTEKTYKLVSERVSIGNRDFSLPLPTSVRVKKGLSTQLSATVPFYGGQYKIQDNFYYNNTYWQSANTAVATVSGSGLVRGVKAGSTTVKVKFSGKEFSVGVTVDP